MKRREAAFWLVISGREFQKSLQGEEVAKFSTKEPVVYKS